MRRLHAALAVAIFALFSITCDLIAQEASDWRQAYREISKDAAAEDSRRQTQIALWCFEKGLISEGCEHLDLALRKPGEKIVFRKAAERGREQGWLSDAWKALAAASSAQGEVKSWMTLACGKSPARTLLSEMALDTADPEVRRLACRTALQSPRIELRSYAVGKISTWFPAETAGSLLLERSLCDLEPSVREKATLAFRPERTREACSALTPFLSHAKPSARIHAAEALGTLGEMNAIPSLIASWKASAARAAAAASAGGGSRAYAYFGTQQAYVRDFDVQIATAATIAKPVIGILHSGSVIDVRVLGVSEEVAMSLERRVLHAALVKIAGRDFGADPNLWQNWWSQKNATTTPN